MLMSLSRHQPHRIVITSSFIRYLHADVRYEFVVNELYTRIYNHIKAKFVHEKAQSDERFMASHGICDEDTFMRELTNQFEGCLPGLSTYRKYSDLKCMINRCDKPY